MQAAWAESTRDCKTKRVATESTLVPQHEFSSQAYVVPPLSPPSGAALAVRVASGAGSSNFASSGGKTLHQAVCNLNYNLLNYFPGSSAEAPQL
jgi:hypothetical protein